MPSRNTIRLVTLTLLIGMLCCACVFLWINANYEDRLYKRLIDGILVDESSQHDKALALLHAAHELVKPREAIFAHAAPRGIREIFLASGDLALIEGSGNCGSYTHVLARALQSAGMQVRIAQMRCAKRWGCHILLEARVEERWVVLDPSFDLAFFNQDGTLASFQQVRRDWQRHRLTLPADYPQEYAYEGVRYTNWSKIPVLMPAIKQLLDVLIGKTADEISIRAHVLNLYRVYFWICATLLLVIAVVSIRWARSETTQSQKALAETTRSTGDKKL